MKTDTHEMLVFKLGSEEYGVDILKVQEIRGWDEPTAIPNSPAFIKGVINLRGVIVPVLDLRMKFNLPQADYDRFTVVIILNVASRVIGIVVDAVSDVLSLDKEAIRKTPEFASAAFDTRFITGLATLDEQMLVLLDIEKLMTASDMALVDASLQ